MVITRLVAVQDVAGLDFDEEHVPTTTTPTRAELLLLSPSFRVPRLVHDGVTVWDTLAIAEYLHEVRPEAGVVPDGPADRAHVPSICGEIHSGFANLRSGCP